MRKLKQITDELIKSKMVIKYARSVERGEYDGKDLWKGKF